MIVKEEKKKKPEDRALLQKSAFAINRTVEAGVTLSAPQRKALNAVHYALQSYVKMNFDSIDLFNAKYQDRVMDFKIKRQQFLALIAYMSRNQVHLRGVLRQLSRIQIDWRSGQVGDRESYFFTNIFMEAGLHDGFVHVKIPPQTRQALVNDNVEATVDIIKVSRSLFGKYSISLYDVVQSHFEKCDDNFLEFDIEDEVLRNSLTVPYKWGRRDRKVYSYPTVGKLNDKVLKPAVAEINEADLEFKLEHSHTKLGCGTVVWTFKVTRTSFTQHRIIANEFASEMASLTKSFAQFGVKRPLELLTQICSEKDVLYLQFCVEQVEKAMRSRKAENKIKNPAGYFLKAVEHNREAFEEHYQEFLDTRHKEKRRAREAEQQRIDEQIEAETKRQRRRLRDAEWNALASNTQDELRAEFMEFLKNSPAWGVKYSKLVVEQGVEASPRLNGAWLSFLDDKLGITDEAIAESIQNMVITSTFR